MTAQDVLKVVAHWSGYGEEGTLSAYFQSAGTHSDQLLANAAGNISTQFGTGSTPSMWTRLSNLLTPQQNWDEIAVYQYNALPGKVSNQGKASVSAQPGTGAQVGNLQDALVVTTLTAESGATKRGRMYFPAHCIPKNSATACMAAGWDQTITNYASQFLDTIASALASTLNATDPLDAVVYSPTKGYVTPITRLRADNKGDTQRRRAFSLQASSEYSKGYPS